MADNQNPPINRIADPAPLGLMAFGMTTVLLSFHNLGLFGLDSSILNMGIFYGGLAQIIAGIFEFKRGNTFGATAFTSFGFFWLSFVAINTGMLTDIGSESAAVGAYFAIWGLMTFFMFIGTLKSPVSLRVVFFTLTILFFVVAAKDLSGIAEIAYVAGAVGIICGGSAMYTAAGHIINEQHGRNAVPLG
ncbi:MAG: acetate uptake transporter [Candidatus Methanoplasma sp.]|jgi:succinate-acetate transporter protein|nr:acetate uptake transporter [Candidatus Methanoplasma sp.]